MVTRKYKTLVDYFDQTGSTHQELADKVGVTRSCIHYWVTGKRYPTLGLALKLSHVTGVPLEALVRDEEAVA